MKTLEEEYQEMIDLSKSIIKEINLPIDIPKNTYYITPFNYKYYLHNIKVIFINNIAFKKFTKENIPFNISSYYIVDNVVYKSCDKSAKDMLNNMKKDYYECSLALRSLNNYTFSMILYLEDKIDKVLFNQLYNKYKFSRWVENDNTGFRFDNFSGSKIRFRNSDLNFEIYLDKTMVRRRCQSYTTNAIMADRKYFYKWDECCEKYKTLKQQIESFELLYDVFVSNDFIKIMNIYKNNKRVIDSIFIEGKNEVFVPYQIC